MRTQLEKAKNNWVLWTFGIAPASLVVLWIYGQIEKSSREDLACKGQPDCVDLRGLGNLYLAFLFISFVALMGALVAFTARKKNQKFAVPALIFNAVIAVLFLGISISAYFSSH